LNTSCKVYTALSAVAAVLLGFGGVSFADTLAPQPLDPSAGSIAAGVNAGRSWVTTYGIPAMIAAIIFGALVGAGFLWLRRATHRATAGH
jgi:hypothetical protein